MPNPLTRAEALRRIAFTVWATIGVIALIWIFLVVADSVRIIWLPLAFAGGLTLLLNPVVDALERVRVPRLLGTIFAFLVAASLIAATVVLLIPALQEQGSDFAAQLPSLYDGVVRWLNEVSETVGIDLGEVWTSETIKEWIQNPDNQATIQDLLGGFGSGAGRILRGVTETIAVALLAPVLAFYMLMDSTKFKQRSLELTPPPHREEVSYVTGQVVTALGSFVRGQLLVALIVGILSSIGLYFLDLPFWLLIGLTAGFLNLVPFVGPFVGGALAAIVALFNGSLSQALWAVGIFTAIQQFDNHVVTPLVQRARVNLSPLVIVLALIAGGSLAGLLGVVLAVPIVTALRIVAGHLWRTRVLGESWQEASDAMIEITERPERMTVRRRRVEGDQQRLFDTAETPVVSNKPAEPTSG
ncbi:MAG TPA: AI-2E family transporter [Acidimicrobiia bacterium]|nr:AI-2E family transporter [Acidimicrobiia bacterium]